MADGNGPSRREFDELRGELRELRIEMRRLDHEGSTVTRRLEDRLGDLREDFKDFREGPFADVDRLQKWIVRSFMAAFVLAVIAAVFLQSRGQGTG